MIRPEAVGAGSIYVHEITYEVMRLFVRGMWSGARTARTFRR
jgi:hypothetical protein